MSRLGERPRILIRLDREAGMEFPDLVRRAIYEVELRLVATAIYPFSQKIIGSMGEEHFAFLILRGFTAEEPAV